MFVMSMCESSDVCVSSREDVLVKVTFKLKQDVGDICGTVNPSNCLISCCPSVTIGLATRGRLSLKVNHCDFMKKFIRACPKQHAGPVNRKETLPERMNNPAGVTLL